MNDNYEKFEFEIQFLLMYHRSNDDSIHCQCKKDLLLLNYSDIHPMEDTFRVSML